MNNFFHSFLYIFINENKLDILSISKTIKYNRKEQIKLDYENNSFAIITRNDCINCGLFSYFQICLGCINYYINKGYIPIIELLSFPNIFNGFKVNNLNENPWEIFFEQPYGYKLKDVLKYSKNIKFFKCGKDGYSYPDRYNIYKNKILIDFWHNIATNYLKIKNKIIIEVRIIMKKLFNKSNNILGVLMRGTDFIARKPKYHCIPQTPDNTIKDIIEMDKKNDYDWIFLATEDDIIRKKFIKKFKNKLKYLKPKQNIEYDYNAKKLLSLNKNIKGNLINMKIYLFNIIILSKCIDIIVSRTSGAVGAFILSEGFRNDKIYYLGTY